MVPKMEVPMDGKILEAKFLKADAVATLLQISQKDVYNKAARGAIPCVHLFGGRRMRFKRADIEKLLDPSNCESENRIE